MQTLKAMIRAILTCLIFIISTISAYTAAIADQQLQTLTGEVVDIMCYVDHGAKGAKHQECAQMCIKSGGPVGLLVDDKLYLVIGDHKPMNDILAPLAAQIITLKGKVVERNGLQIIENAEVVKE